nr:immunoglobulin heavy chain junction region [Macaca mulatta]
CATDGGSYYYGFDSW